MKVMAINSSPRHSGESKTELMMSALVEGMREAGAEVSVFNLRQKKLNYCIGCYTCWTKTPGVCIHKDDMTAELYPQWLESDLAVYATPLYHFTVNASLKTFIERTLPILRPDLLHNDGETRHPLRGKHPQIAVLSVAGFPEESVFKGLSCYVRSVFGKRLAAEIYRAGAEALTISIYEEKKKNIIAATIQGGRELVEQGAISPETMEKIKQPISDAFAAFSELANLMWKTCISEGVTPEEFRKKGIIPRPDTLENFMLLMEMAFNPQRAGDLAATIQFEFTDEEKPKECYFKIDRGTVKAAKGRARKADLTINTPFELWMDVMSKKADGQQLFWDQQYTTEGDVSLLINLDKVFGNHRNSSNGA
ncbi:MAG: NAD(P)H-dependent oxidoreductase [Smithellaceae bacterium]|nr:NAD(P)H-dependent oxidoreductase [Smithellaceae bacterium]